MGEEATGPQPVPWSAAADRTFADLMRIGPPEVFREAATARVSGAAEAHARDRGAALVELQDVVRACLSVTPVPFRPKMLEDLDRLGIDPGQFGLAP